MKIAVTYDDGEIFQHFGKTEFFKVYEAEDNQIISSEVIGSNGTGHGALAGLLADQGIDVLICGGIGGGAQAALDEAGVKLCAGVHGDADEAAKAYLRTAIITITKRVIPAAAMEKSIPAAAMRMAVPAAAAQVDAAAH